MFAASLGRTANVAELLRRIAPARDAVLLINARTTTTDSATTPPPGSQQWTALMCASGGGHGDCVALLLRYGARHMRKADRATVDAWRTAHGQTPLFGVTAVAVARRTSGPPRSPRMWHWVRNAVPAGNGTDRDWVIVVITQSARVHVYSEWQHKWYAQPNVTMQYGNMSDVVATRHVTEDKM